MRSRPLLRVVLSITALCGMLGVTVGMARDDGDDHGKAKRGALFVMS